jgi:hypothetical protein
MTYVTGTGQQLFNIHPKMSCAGQNCVIHNPSDHHMRDWPTHWRDELGLMERLCPHGIGHPDPDSLDYLTGIGHEDRGTHGCDGCCNHHPCDTISPWHPIDDGPKRGA